MAIFGRNTARQRLRRASRESLKIPAFRSPVDCTPWVTGGLWPAKLSTITAQTAPLVRYLKADLQKIVEAANDELLGIQRAGLADPIRQAEEARVITAARGFAVRRVESTVRQLRSMAPQSPPDPGPGTPVHGVNDTDTTRRLTLASVPTPLDVREPPTPGRSGHREGPAPGIDAPTSVQGADVAAAEPGRPRPGHQPGSDDTEVLDGLATVLAEIAPRSQAPVDDAPRQPPAARRAQPGDRVADEPATTYPPMPAIEAESEPQRLHRLLTFVARQEPGLRWAVGTRADGTTLVVTDLAHGWIPPGITLPDGVALLGPDRRTGTAPALLGHTSASATHNPGDPPDWATDHQVEHTSSRPRELPAIDDLGRHLGDATHWREGMPRMVHPLAKAAAAGTGVPDGEIEVLRVHLDASRYQLVTQYPDIDTALLLNCQLLAALEALATGNPVEANYHFAWFRALATPPGSR